MSVISFGIFVFSSDENVLDAEKAFVSLSLFNSLRQPMTMLPMTVSNLIQVLKQIYSNCFFSQNYGLKN